MSQQTPAREYALGLFNALSKDRYLTDYELNLIERALIKYAEGECDRLTLEKAELVKGLETIKMRAHKEPAEELEDAHRDMRHIYATANAALAKEAKP